MDVLQKKPIKMKNSRKLTLASLAVITAAIIAFWPSHRNNTDSQSSTESADNSSRAERSKRNKPREVDLSRLPEADEMTTLAWNSEWLEKFPHANLAEPTADDDEDGISTYVRMRSGPLGCGLLAAQHFQILPTARLA